METAVEPIVQEPVFPFEAPQQEVALTGDPLLMSDELRAYFGGALRNTSGSSALVQELMQRDPSPSDLPSQGNLHGIDPLIEIIGKFNWASTNI